MVGILARVPVRARSLALMLAGLVAGPACGETIAPTYSVAVVTPTGDNPFVGAAQVTMQVGNRPEVAARVAADGKSFEVDDTGLRPDALPPGPVVVRGRGSDGALIAFGTTPPLAFALQSTTVSVFVQRPGTLGRLPVARATLPLDHMVVASVTVPNGGPDLLLHAYGRSLATGLDGTLFAKATTAGGLWNPALVTYTQPYDTATLPRVDAAAVDLGDGSALVFGGLTDLAPMPGADPSVAPWAIGSAVQLATFRTSLVGYDQDVLRGVQAVDAAVARGRTALVRLATGTFAFGGEAQRLDPGTGAWSATALDDVVRIAWNEADAARALALLPVRMSSPRVGHTATTLRATGAAAGALPDSALLFGGRARTGALASPAAEVFVGATGMFVPVADAAGAGRSDHAALTLPSGRVVLIGGRDASGAPLADSWVFDPMAGTLAPGPVTLREARFGAAAFLVGGDLVLAGGVGAQGAVLGSAEVFDVAALESATSPLPAVAVVPATARVGAAAHAFANQTVLLLGGSEPDPGLPTLGPTGGRPSSVSELYQPRAPLSP